MLVNVTAAVRATGVIYTDAANNAVEALGVEVVADESSVYVNSVGFEVESDAGGAQLFVGLKRIHPQPPLPHTIPGGESAMWMMSLTEIREAFTPGSSANLMNVMVDLDTARFRPFAQVDGTRVSGEAVALPR